MLTWHSEKFHFFFRHCLGLFLNLWAKFLWALKGIRFTNGKDDDTQLPSSFSTFSPLFLIWMEGNVRAE